MLSGKAHLFFFFNRNACSSSSCSALRPVVQSLGDLSLHQLLFNMRLVYESQIIYELILDERLVRNALLQSGVTQKEGPFSWKQAL